LAAKNEDGIEVPYIETVQDDETAGPELATMLAHDEAAMEKALLAIPDKKERDAVYYRDLCEFDWQEVAELLKCSVPTARKYRDLGIEKIRKALK
jgi:DNA-directed RNA polymerase specialized sigma24 family protein